MIENAETVRPPPTHFPTHRTVIPAQPGAEEEPTQKPMVYEVSVTYTVEVTDRSALMSQAFERFCSKLRRFTT